MVYLCACVASDEISHLCMRWQGKVDRSQVIQCISLVGETGDEDTCYQTVQHSWTARKSDALERLACGEPFMMMMMVVMLLMMPIFMRIGKILVTCVYACHHRAVHAD